MKETVGSLRAYFILVSVLGIAGSVMALGALQVNPLFLVTGLIGLAFSVAYLYVGISLRKLLVESPGLIESLLFASMTYQLIIFLLTLFNGFQTGSVIQFAFSLLILWYLLSSVRRLSKEIESKAQSE
jgi:hypothetical protein